MTYEKKMIHRYSNWDAYQRESLNCREWCKSEDVEKLEEQNKQLLQALIYKQKVISNVHCTNCTDKNINDFCIHCIYNFEKITGKKPEEHNV